ncbi:54S ribosomal protein L4 mitochondrial [Elasticomyces elasticus]|nr:hypothetical protein LTR28_008252 [Elasticomyces elasticus]KAK4992797.1 54S ribosomal protein L4 mitochondrial [Elasticomyces elasticus]KAK4995787.1 54S ribosomal protein L4 mitochondrial [Elasticomyces elasticus]
MSIQPLRSALQASSFNNASVILPAFLVPSVFRVQSSSFSTTSHLEGRRDANRNRGVSALRRTGLRKRQTLSVKVEDLPKPVLDPAQRSKVEVDENHALWQFFSRDKQPFYAVEQLSAHGRPWTVEELRRKDWEDLHRLWWVCVKERNRLATEAYERERVNAGYGEYEYLKRVVAIKRTQRAIKHTLTERWYGWEDARKVAQNDPEVNLNAIADGGAAYTPSRKSKRDKDEKPAAVTAPDPALVETAVAEDLRTHVPLPPDQPSIENRARA